MSAVASTCLDLPVLGVGMGYRDRYAKEVFEHADEIGFLEITADHFLEAPKPRREFLDRLRDRFTLIPHGLNLSLGSAEGLNRPYLEQLAGMVELVQPPWWSEHICFTQAGGVEIGHLAPVPFSREGLDTLCENIRIANECIETPLILENITYPFAMPGTDCEEVDFLNELLDRTGCGLLLDVTNLFINSQTHNYPAEEFLKRLPGERIVQLHFVGGQLINGKWVDSHAQATNPEIWELMDAVLQHGAVKGAILERDTNFPAFDEVRGELKQAREIGSRHGRWD
ncbi:MAG: DUF692 domain-containing protein [Limisphaerales bacterium]